MAVVVRDCERPLYQDRTILECYGVPVYRPCPLSRAWMDVYCENCGNYRGITIHYGHAHVHCKFDRSQRQAALEKDGLMEGGRC